MAEPRAIRITIDARGGLAANPGGTGALGALKGEYELLPSTGDLLLLRRVAPVQGGTPPPRVAFAGLVDQPGGLVEVINHVLSNQWTGELTVLMGPVRKVIFFHRGDVRAAASSAPDDRLGAILFKYGVVTQAQLDEALAQAGTAARIGQTLVQRGALSPHDLFKYIRRQIEQIFESLLMVASADFYFSRTPEDAVAGAGGSGQTRISTQTLLFDGMRRIDELSFFRGKISSGEVVLARTSKLPSEPLPPLAQATYDAIDGRLTLIELARRVHLSEFEVTKIVHQLMHGGLVVEAVSLPGGLVPEAVSGPAGTTADPLGQMIDVFNEFYGRIFAAVSARGHQSMLIHAVASFVESTTDYAALFQDVHVDAGGLVPRDTLLANLARSEAKDKLTHLHHGLNELLFFELFTAGESVDPKEEAALYRRLNEILNQVRPA